MRVLYFSLLCLLFLSLSALAQERAVMPVDTSYFSDLDFRMVGPSRGGRVTAVAGHPAHPETFYMGATGGGVWKTTDYGQTWFNKSDGYFETASIGAIRVAPSADSIVYVGTGSDGIRSNIIIGRGLYKSTDGGDTWKRTGLRAMGQITSVEVHPSNPDLVFAAALGDPFKPTPERGVYRTVDGGDTWDLVFFLSDSTGAVDIELNPADPDEVYAAMWRAERKPWTIISGDTHESGIYKSTDGGDTWSKLTNGLPSTLVGKIDLAVSPADQDRLYALVEAPDDEEGLYRSDDRGASFRLVSKESGLMRRPFYYTNVDAAPDDADVVYVNNEGFFKSTDGGEKFVRMSTPHGDNHDMWINPDDPDLFIQSNDGGANVTRDGGQTWSTQYNQPTAELYQLHIDDNFPYWLYAGQQDNSTIMVPSLPPAESAASGPESWWKSIGGCETGPAVPRPGDPNIVYSNCKGRFGRYNVTTGQEQQYYVGAQNMYGRNPAELILRFQRVVPIEVSPHDPDVVYHGSQYVHRTTDEGRTWETISPDLTAQPPGMQVVSGGPITRDITGEEHYSTLYEIRESNLEPGLIWAGSNDGPVHVTRDDGLTWTDVTPPDLPPLGRIETIEPSPHQPGKAFFATYRYLVGDFEPYIYKTENYGATWTRLTDGTNGIPIDYPTRVVREDPDREGLLYAGTDFGLFISFDDGANWQSFQQDLPVTPVTDIRIHQKDLVLATMGRSFWILDNITPLHEIYDGFAEAGRHLFVPREAYRMRYRAGRSGPHEPEYPPPGILIDFYIESVPAEAVQLDILDAEGLLIRRFETSESEEADEPADPVIITESTAAGPVTVEELEVAAGHNRFRWDLRYTATWREGRLRSDGPLAPPGTYRVRLTIGEWRQSHPITVLIDPRIAADGITSENLIEQWALNLQIRDDVSEARQTADAVEKALEQLEDGHVEKGNLERLLTMLVDSEEGSYPAPMLINQIEYLYGMTTRADQRPGQDAYTRFYVLRNELDAVVSGWKQVKARLNEP